MTVGEMLDRMSSSELVGWWAYRNLYPFGQFVEEERHADVMHFHYESTRDRKKRSWPFKKSDFYVSERQIRVSDQPVDWQAHKASFKALAEGSKGKPNGKS